MTPAEIARLLGHSAPIVARYYARDPHMPGRAPTARDHDHDRSGSAAERRLRDDLARAASNLAFLEREAWRDYHGATVASAPSLALALFAHEGFDLDEVVCGLGPDGCSPEWLVGAGFAAHGRGSRWSGRKGAADVRFADERERFLHSGRVLLRRPGLRRGGGALGVRLSRFGLEVGLRLDGLILRTLADEATVVVAEPVPETVRLAMLGRPLRDLVDHPALRDPALVVMDVDALAGRPLLRPEAWAMTVRVPRVPWRLPWARGTA